MSEMMEMANTEGAQLNRERNVYEILILDIAGALENMEREMSELGHSISAILGPEPDNIPRPGAAPTDHAPSPLEESLASLRNQACQVLIHLRALSERIVM